MSSELLEVSAQRPELGDKLPGVTARASVSGERYAYLRFGNVADELRRLAGNGAAVPKGGSTAYVPNFLNAVGAAPVLLLSVHFGANSVSADPRTADVAYRDGNVDACSFYWYGKEKGSAGSGRRSLLGNLRVRLAGSIKIFRRLLDFRPTKILCGLNGFPLWTAYLAARLRGAQLVCSIHTRFALGSDPLYHRLIDYIDKKVIVRASAVICHGPYLKKLLVDIGVEPGRIVEFNWSYRDIALASARDAQTPDLSAAGRYRVILFIGRMINQKGIYDLLDACAERLRGAADLRLVYAGNGEELAELQARVDALGLASKVVLLGMVPYQMMGRVIAQSALVVTPTRTVFPEGLCMATREALVAGIPVVAPNFGPFPYVVEDGVNGKLFVPDSVADLRRQILALLDDTALYARLREGALQSGRTLRQGGMDYQAAVSTAFDLQH